MTSQDFNSIFTQEAMLKIFPADRADLFFDALYGDASEGAYDISLNFVHHEEDENALLFEFQLHERPGKCLACNLTYGLPEVFARHPIIDVKGVVAEIEKISRVKVQQFQIGATNSVSKDLHTMPLKLQLA